MQNAFKELGEKTKDEHEDGEKMVTGFRKRRASNTPETYRHPRLFPGTES